MLNIPLSEQQEGTANWLLARALASTPTIDNFNLAAALSPGEMGVDTSAAGLSDSGITLRRALVLNALLNRDENGSLANNIALAGAVANEGMGFGQELVHLGDVAGKRLLDDPFRAADTARALLSEVARQKQMALGMSALALLLRFGPRMNATEQ
jgi:hypothetical protein